jgi:hypothetical protein
VTYGGAVVARAVRTAAGASLAAAKVTHGSDGFPAVSRASDGTLLQDVISVFVLPEHSCAGASNTLHDCMDGSWVDQRVNKYDNLWIGNHGMSEWMGRQTRGGETVDSDRYKDYSFVLHCKLLWSFYKDEY